jgi:hypothetical protein
MVRNLYMTKGLPVQGQGAPAGRAPASPVPSEPAKPYKASRGPKRTRATAEPHHIQQPLQHRMSAPGAAASPSLKAFYSPSARTSLAADLSCVKALLGQPSARLPHSLYQSARLFQEAASSPGARASGSLGGTRKPFTPGDDRLPAPGRVRGDDRPGHGHGLLGGAGYPLPIRG